MAIVGTIGIALVGVMGHIHIWKKLVIDNVGLHVKFIVVYDIIIIKCKQIIWVVNTQVPFIVHVISIIIVR